MLLTQNKEIDIFIGSTIGSFKHIKYHSDPAKNTKKCVENLVELKSLQKEDRITCMVWADEHQSEILIGKKNQQIQLYNTEHGSFAKTYLANFGTGHVVGLGRCKRKLLAALSSGVVKIWSKKDEVCIDTGGKLDKMRLCSDDPTIFATGGEENDVKLWKIGEMEPTFVGKNLANDWLQLRRPVWVTDLVCLPGQGGRLVAVCSRHGYSRLYDARAQRRPVCNVDFPGLAATCLAPSFDDRQILVGFGRGQLHQVDLRQGRLDRGFKGCAGGVASVSAAGDSARLVLSASLDRRVRVHDYATKRLLYEQYVTTKPTCLLVQTVGSTPLRNYPQEEVKEEKEEVEAEDELDHLFDNMETVGEKPKKKRLQTEDGGQEKKFKPSTEGSTDVDLDESENREDAIMKLLRSTEKQKRRMEKRKKEKKAKSVFHNA